MLIELSDPSNESLIKRFQSEVIISPMVLSHLLAGIALQQELNSIYNELFTVGGAEIYFPGPHGIRGFSWENTLFLNSNHWLALMGETVLGVYLDREDEAGKPPVC